MDSTALFKLSYGLYVVTARDGDKDNGCVINTAVQVTSSPARLCVTVNKDNLTHDMITHSGRFALSALTQEAPMELIRRFGFSSGRDGDKFFGIDYHRDENGVAYLSQYSAARFSLKLEQTLDVGTHTMFVGIIEEAEKLDAAEPMSYSYYHAVKKGGAPKTAPSYQEPVKPAETKPAGSGAPVGKRKFRCSICGYVYDEAVEGTVFEELPADYTCPVCGVPKDLFEEIAE